MNQSRMMTMAAMLEDHSFEVSRYVVPIEWSEDWSRTPDGKYYSNKPPGPMLIGFPVYAVLDKLINHSPHRSERDQFRVDHKMIYMWTLGVLFQLLPILFLFYGTVLHFRLSLYQELILFFCILYGNTASFYYSNWGGHGLHAFLNLALMLALVKRKQTYAGFLFGLALLTDYSQALLLFPTLFVLWMLRKNFAKELGLFAAGGMVPAMMWIYYHFVCFGSPFKIANHFQNPMFLDVVNEKSNLFGTFYFFPRFEATWQLWFGDTRGMIKNQPWIPFFIATLLFKYKKINQQPLELKAMTAFVLMGLLLLFWMNASFGHWDGGWGMGPRYMSSIFPSLALVMVLWIPSFSKQLRALMAIGVVYASCYFFYFNSFRTYFLDHLSGAEWFDSSMGRWSRMIIGIGLTVAFARFLFVKTSKMQEATRTTEA